MMDVWGDALVAPSDFALDLSSINQLAPPHTSKIIGRATREKVLERIRAALVLAGLQYQTDRRLADVTSARG